MEISAALWALWLGKDLTFLHSSWLTLNMRKASSLFWQSSKVQSFQGFGRTVVSAEKSKSDQIKI